MEMEQYDLGVPSWVDLGSPDVDRSAAFYGALFEWNVMEGPPEAGGYRMCMRGGKAVAGLGPQMDPEGPSAWLTYVNVDDADAVAARVTAARGQIVAPPFDVLTVGRAGVFRDPAGAFFAIWQAGEHKGAGLVDEPGAYCWSELVTGDPDAAVAFYGAVFGWGAQVAPPAGPLEYCEWQVAGRSIGGMMPRPPDMPDDAPSYWGVYFAVADVDASCATASDLGATTLVGPTDIEPGRFALLLDPTGAMFSVIKMNESVGG